jgi:uncharacterized protein YcsI (UPF0317 family)
MAFANARDARLAYRAGLCVETTVGVAPGHVQANLVVLPRDLAAAFRLYCERNSQPCPLLGWTEPGDPHLPALGWDLDLRTDLPRYQVWRDGELVAEPVDVRDVWRDDLVGFALGCSYSFDDVLGDAGIRLRHLELGVNPPLYESNLDATPAGPFRGKIIVSMRPLLPSDVIRAVQVTSRYPHAHGAPIHLGDPAMIGIGDLARPFGGHVLPLLPGELPVFWACGVTPQTAIRAARPAFCITHWPGAMLVTDLLNRDMAVPQ